VCHFGKPVGHSSTVCDVSSSAEGSGEGWRAQRFRYLLSSFPLFPAFIRLY
jgi:hypothetical protein